MSELMELNQETLKAELDTQITTAKAYPRDIKKAISDMIEMATISQEVAEGCYFTLKRKDKSGKQIDIFGPSIRLAEIAISCWGNLHIGRRIVKNDGKTITGQGVCWDLEKNVKADICIDRNIMTSSGYSYSQDMQIMSGNAAASMALRNAVFTVIPKVYIDSVYNACRKSALGEGNLFIKKRTQVFERFAELGIDSKNIISFFGKNSIEDFNEENVSDLIGIGTSIKEGIVDKEEAFYMNEETSNLDIEERIKMLTGK